MHLQYARLYEGCYSGFKNEQDAGPSLKEPSVCLIKHVHKLIPGRQAAIGASYQS